MKRLIIFLCFAGFPAFSFAQSTSTVKGRILSALDSTAIVGARITTSTGTINSTSTADGSFTLGGVPRSEKTIKAILMGFETLETAVELNDTNVDLGTLYMAETANEITPVVVTGTPPIVVTKADTMEFRASAYKTSPDADADQLIMKMPGVVIQSGRVEAQGEPVRRIYVDGKLFFGSDPMAALKNIPADAVESIQIFDEQSEMARLTGFEDGDTRKAINIVTKSKDKETRLFKSELSGGADFGGDRRLGTGRYLAGGNYSQFDEKQRITLTVMGNNVNTKRFGENEMADEAEVDENGNLKNQPAGISQLFGLGANYSYESKKMKFSGSYFYDRNENHTIEHRFLSYSPDTKGKYTLRHTFRNPALNSTQHNQRFDARLEWRPDAQNTIVFTPRISLQKNDARDRWEELTMQDRPQASPPLPFDSTNRTITQYPVNSRFYSSFSGGLYLTHRFAAKRGRSVSMSVNYNINLRDNNAQQIDLLRQEFKNGAWQDAKATSFTDRISGQTTDNSTISARFSYTEPFLKYHRFQLTLIAKKDWGGSEKTSYNNVNRGIADTIPDYSDLNRAQSEHFTRIYNTLGGGIGYALYRKKLTLNSGIDFQRIGQRRETYMPTETDTRLSFPDVQPWMSMKYSIQKKSYLRVQYRGKTVLPRIDQMHNTINDANLSHLRQGNPDLKEGYEHSLIVFYNRSNTVKNRNVTFTLNARTISNFVAPRTQVLGEKGFLVSESGDTAQFQTNAFLTQYVNLNGYAAIRTSTTYSQAIRAIRSNMNLSVAYNFIRTPSLFGDTTGVTLNYANLHSGGVRVGLTSNISENVDFNFYSNTAFNFTRNSSKDNTSFINQNLYYSLNVVFPLDIVFNTLITWRHFSSSTMDETSSFWAVNAGVGKKLFRERNGELRLTMYDMFNQSRNILHFVRDNYVEDRETNNLQRYVMLRFSYRFNSMTHGRKKPAALPAGTNFQDINLKDLKKMSNLQQKK